MDDADRLDKLCAVMARWGVSRVSVGDVTVEMRSAAPVTAQTAPVVPEYDPGIPVTLDDLKRMTLPSQIEGD